MSRKARNHWADLTQRPKTTKYTYERCAGPSSHCLKGRFERSLKGSTELHSVTIVSDFVTRRLIL